MDLNCTRSISLHLLERRHPSTLPVITRFAFACLAVLTLTMPARSQIEALQRGDIRSDDDILSSGSRKRGKRQGKNNVITPNMLQALGADSIGDASLLNARPSRTARVSSLSRSLFETLKGTTFLVRPYLSDLRCVNDQSTNIFKALLDAPAGAAVAFPPGCIRAAGGLINNGRVWVGAGTGDEGTEFQFTGTEGAGLKLMGAGAQFDNFRVTCTANRATSQLVGIQMSDGVENPRGQRINSIKMKDCYDQIDVRSGEFWSITHFDMYRAARYGLRVRNLFESDSGDGSLTSGVIYTDVVAGGKAAIRWESGGGFKVSGTKTLQFDRCFDMAIADGVLTKILWLDSSNSFENSVTGECIKLGRIEGGRLENSATSTSTRRLLAESESMTVLRTLSSLQS